MEQQLSPKEQDSKSQEQPIDDDVSSNDSKEYENESDAESIDDYRHGGYHPVVLGEKFNNGKYQVIQKLGFGYFSTVWLCQNLKTKHYYALKIQKSKEHYSESVLDEIEILEDLKSHQSDDEWKNTRDQILSLIHI
eukprot:TRINITY_DN7711_c0_g1_i8.p2 TRINITY_DN7711_c0_g1~~TRINITY_DN7711_c0_g1_i8.p2  ORF type:complete len:136 (-),score=26.40 TRINITY_DN7711_c0_g1_i8:61-468(-)